MSDMLCSVFAGTQLYEITHLRSLQYGFQNAKSDAGFCSAACRQQLTGSAGLAWVVSPSYWPVLNEIRFARSPSLLRW
jgi:hypothetical protein